jgi:methylthioribulose-1-phosphate dehydratase
VSDPLFPQLPGCARQIVEMSHILYSRGWSPATSSNYSVRLDARHCAITVSGKDKGKLTEQDVMVVDLDGKPVSINHEAPNRPSAETLLHTNLYHFDPAIGAVLHTHSVNATLLTLQRPGITEFHFDGYEIVKAFSGVTTHEHRFSVPVFANQQDIPVLAAQVDRWLQMRDKPRAYLIRGHGLYTWGVDMAECFRHLEAMEFLLECEVKRLSLATQE